MAPMAPTPRHPRAALRSPWRWARRLLLILMALPVLALALLAGAVWLTLPGTDAALRMAGLSAPVEIGFDEGGIPVIRAGSERDAAVAMGVLHVWDRILQMEMNRRGVVGRMR